MDQPFLIIKRSDIEGILEGRDAAIMQSVEEIYMMHDRSETSLPHSVFLRFPNDPDNRIIGLPALIGVGEEAVAGMKWIASFPHNHVKNLPRASAVVVVNSTETGFPEAILEGSLISVIRTAASAALAANYLRPASNYDSIGVVGAGVIALETLRFILGNVAGSEVKLKVFDTVPASAVAFVESVRHLRSNIDAEPAANINEAMQCRLVLFATTASEPFVSEDVRFLPGSTILHISLRDLPPALVLRHRNIVDDLSHVNREKTSIHLASTATGRTDFVSGTLADLIDGRIPARENESEVVIFSPFGLGILDIGLAHMILNDARRLGIGFEIDDFFAYTDKAETLERTE